MTILIHILRILVTTFLISKRAPKIMRSICNGSKHAWEINISHLLCKGGILQKKIKEHLDKLLQ